jgi:hypothetical protein
MSEASHYRDWANGAVHEDEEEQPQCPSCDSFGVTTSCGACGWQSEWLPPLTCDWCGCEYHGQAGDLACEEAKKEN